MKLLFLPPTLSHPNPSFPTSTISCFYKPPKSLFPPPTLSHPNPSLRTTPIETQNSIPPTAIETQNSIPPTPIVKRYKFKLQERDRVMEFGRHKGSMLGTLPPSYLRWVSEKLREGEKNREWATYADQVLADPVYQDRIEWEFALRIMTGNDFARRVTGSDCEGGREALHDVAERFGWDFGEDSDWSKVKFDYIGTSRSGRIPRICNRKTTEVRKTGPVKKEKARVSDSEGSGREKRRERLRSKRNERPTEAKTRMVLSGIDRVDDSDGKIDQNRERLRSKRNERPTEAKTRTVLSGIDRVDGSDGKIDQNRTAEIPKFPGRESVFMMAMKRSMKRNN